MEANWWRIYPSCQSIFYYESSLQMKLDMRWKIRSRECDNIVCSEHRWKLVLTLRCYLLSKEVSSIAAWRFSKAWREKIEILAISLWFICFTDQFTLFSNCFIVSLNTIQSRPALSYPRFIIRKENCLSQNRCRHWDRQEKYTLLIIRHQSSAATPPRKANFTFQTRKTLSLTHSLQWWIVSFIPCQQCSGASQKPKTENVRGRFQYSR